MKRSLDSIQCLRGFAALAVALHHASDQIESFAPFKEGTAPFWLEKWFNTDVGAIGVDVFFLISGFIMAYTTHLRPDITPVDFLRRRFIRIYPLYWFFSFVVIGLHLTPWIGWHAVSLGDSLKSFALYPEFVRYDGLTVVRPVFLPQGWTLIYELLFYLLFATFISLSPLRRITVITGIFGVLALLACLFFPHRPEGALLTDPILFEFPAGLLLGWAFSRPGCQITHRTMVICLALSAAGMLAAFYFDSFHNLPRLICFGLPALLLVGALLLNPATETWKFPRFLKLLGDASYSLYLTHIIVLLLAHTAYIRLSFLQALSYDVYFCMLGAAMVVGGILSYFLVEKPLLNLCRKIS